MLLLCVPAALATTWVVDPSGGGDVTTIRAAVTAAAAGDTVQVAPGTYSEPITVSRAITLEGIGGSANTFLGARSGVVPLVLSADVTLRGFTLEAAGVTALHITEGSVSVEDVVVTDSGDRSGATDTQAVVIDSGVVSFADCSFSGNAGYYGGHVYVSGETVATFADSVFSGGSGTLGGAVNVDGDAVASFIGTRFEDNTASTAGGAVYLQGGGEASFSQCSFAGNRSTFGDGGAVEVNPGGEARFDDVTFDDNLPEPWALYGYGGGAIHARSALVALENVRFTGNAAWYGGAVWVESGELDVSTSRFEDNAAASGGAIRVDGGTLVDYAGDYVGNRADGEGGAVAAVGATVSFSGAGFSTNVAGGSGGGAWADATSVHFESVSFADNAAAVDGGGLYSQGSDVEFDGALFEDNRADGRGGGVASIGDAVAYRGVSLWFNRAEDGGGLAIDAATAWSDADSDWQWNSAEHSGGALWARDTAVLLEGTRADGNTAFTGDGGSVALDGGSLGVVGGHFVSGLATGSGGHIHASGAAVDLADTVLTDGFAVAGDGGALWSDAGAAGTRVLVSGKAERGGGIALFGGRSGDVWQNLAVVGAEGGAIYTEDHPGLTVRHADLLGGDSGIVAVGGVIEVADSAIGWVDGAALSSTGAVVSGGYNLYYANTTDVSGDLSAVPGVGNLSADPRFVAWSGDGEVDNDVLVPLTTSPLLDAGDPTRTDPDGSRADIGYTGGGAASWVDRDGDASPSGLDCDDGDSGRHPGAREAGYDGVDDDCDGLDFDGDGDGHDAADWGGDDCDDTDPDRISDCSGGTDTGSDPVDSGDGGVVEVSGAGVASMDACGCASGSDRGAVGWLGVGVGLLVARRRRGAGGR